MMVTEPNKNMAIFIHYTEIDTPDLSHKGSLTISISISNLANTAFSMLISILADKNFQPQLLIGWQHSYQQIKSHVIKSFLNQHGF